MSGFASMPPRPPSGSTGDRVILRIGARKHTADGTGSATNSRPTSSTQPVPPSEPNTYSRPTSAQQMYYIQPQQTANQQPPVYQQYQPANRESSHPYPPPRSDSTHSLPAANEVYTITRRPSPPTDAGLVHSASAASYTFGGPVRPTSGESEQSRAISRTGSTAALPLAVAIGSDAFHIPPSALSPTNGVGTSQALTLIDTNATSSHTPSSQVISVPSALSPHHSIAVPLIKWSDVSPPELGASSDRATAIKSDFHSNLKTFLKTAKQNIEELTMELFYEEEEEDTDEEEDGDDADGNATVSTPKKKPSPSLVTAATISAASAKQLGSPRKTALLQQLMSLSSNMDDGLASLQSAREAALKRSKEGKQVSGFDPASAAHAPRFNKNDIAQLAQLARDDQKASTAVTATTTAVGKYPAISDATKAALSAFVRRSQLSERHRAYEQWVATKAAAQEKKLAREAREEKLARLREVRERALQEEQSKAEAERLAAEEEALQRELELQREQEAEEERQRIRLEAAERSRLESERREREAIRRAERDAEAARVKLEEEMRARAAEEAAWQREKAEREKAELESLRLAEEMKRQVARDVAMANAAASAKPTDEETQAARDDAELDALFDEATRGSTNGLAGVDEERDDSGENTDEEFAEFGSPRSTSARAAKAAARAAASATAGSHSSRGPAPSPPTGALAGRKGRTVARTMGGFQMPVAPSLPPSVSAAPKPVAMNFGGAVSQPISGVNYRFERAKRMHGR